MQIMVSCTHCRTPFSIKEPEILAALAEIRAHNYKYYTASCPNCGKPNKVPALQLQRAAPRVTPESGTRKESGVSTPKAGPAKKPSPKPKTKGGGAARRKPPSK